MWVVGLHATWEKPSIGYKYRFSTGSYFKLEGELYIQVTIKSS